MQGQYTIERKIRDLPEGFEFKKNRFITDKNKNGCYVTYKSQDGSIKYLMDKILVDDPEWYAGDRIVKVEVDFVPDSHRVLWTEIQKLGKCYLAYDPVTDSWTVVLPENQELNFSLDHPRSQSEAIDTLVYRHLNGSIINNGYRWFDCRNANLGIQKISDDEAKKLQKEIAGT